MKTLSVVLLLLASVAFVLVGCSDNSAVPVSPTEQLAAPASMEKSDKAYFTCTEEHDFYDLASARIWQAGGILQMRNVHAFEDVTASDSRVTGRMEHYLSLSLNVVTGEGPCHGSWTLVPSDPNVTGVWEGTYEGYRSRTENSYVFTLPLKLEGHGRGGSIDGMKSSMKITLIVLTAPAIFPAPYDWSGLDGTGIIIEH